MHNKDGLTLLLVAIMPLATAMMGFALTGCKSAALHASPTQAAGVKIDSTAERMLLYQRTNGGWPQPGGDPIKYNLVLTPSQKQALLAGKGKLDATIDDKATTREINYLVDAYSNTRNESYRKAAERGVAYLLTAQRANGGWGQFYPDSSSYRKQITFNDNAMIDVLWVMKRTAEGTNAFALLDKSLPPLAKKAVDRGVECILKSQFVQHENPDRLGCATRPNYTAANQCTHVRIGIAQR